MAEIPLLLIVAVLAGAFLNVIRGVVGQSVFDYRLFVGTLITASLAAISAAAVLDVASITGQVELFVIGLITGFGVDFSVAKLKKPKVKVTA